MPGTASETYKPWSRAEMAARVARDIPEGWYVNLGIGMPTLVADHVPGDREIIVHSENGILGMGPAPARDKIDPWLVNAGKQHVTLRAGGSYSHHADNDTAPAVGGAMDLAAGAKRLWVLMEHTTKSGESKLVSRCSYPLTAPGVVKRVYTNLAVIDVTPDGFVVTDRVDGLSLEALQKVTDAPLRAAS